MSSTAHTSGNTPRGAKWSAYWRLMRLDRPIGSLLLGWAMLWALWIAGEGSPSLKNILVFCAGVVVMRSAGCVMNDIADREFDPHVRRTRTRPIAAGEVSVREALALFSVLMLVAFGLVLLTNALTIRLAFIGAALAASYPFFKRVTHFPQVVLGLAFGWSIPMAFAAETGGVPEVAWWLLAVNVCWCVIYDTLYAMVDRDDDLLIGVKSTAIRFGRRDLLFVRLVKLAMLALLVRVGLLLGFGLPWYLAVAVVAVLFAVQQYRVRGRDPDACFRAFLDNNWVGLALFAGLLLQYAVA